MIALVFEVYGAVCFFSLIAFLVLAAVAKLRPDLDEEELDLVELEKLKKLVRSEQSCDALPVDAPIIEDAPRSAPARPVKQSKRPVRVRPAPDLWAQASHDLNRRGMTGDGAASRSRQTVMLQGSPVPIGVFDAGGRPGGQAFQA